MKYELREKQFLGLRAKAFSYLMDDSTKDKKKGKGTKSVSLKENFSLKIKKTV